MLCLAHLAVGVLIFLPVTVTMSNRDLAATASSAELMSTGDASSQLISSPSLSDKHDCAIQDVKACRALN